ncbi:hypothetical protein PVK06_020242 [Gossypium arboreum]|uniref:Uncharacterized protein n=1 Tax=Gossypium arboreum TaxID=29729 RepID=A0ABR0PLV8_GOSAR|nr:hypothetical protein PVK06_020242 [Gossypium arboreum]
MPAFLDFPKEFLVAIVEKVGKAQPAEIDLATIEKEAKQQEKEIEKKESISIATDCEEGEEVNPTPTPPMDSTAVVPPAFTQLMTEQDCEINQIINEITKFDDEQEDMPLQLLKRKMLYKHSACKSTLKAE